MDTLTEDQKKLFVTNTNINDYDILKPIGKGKFSIVYKAKRKKDNILVALKNISIFDMMDYKSREKTLKEVRLVQSIRHPNIIQYIDAFINNNELYIIFEWAEAGDLKRQIRKAIEKNSIFEEKIIWKYFNQICLAIQYLHMKCRIMHRDLKPANIFINIKGIIKIGDLGLGRHLSQDTLEAYSKVGTPLYMSPEVLKDNGYDWKSDIWSLGCILYELIMLRSPFKSEGLNLYTLCQKINKGEYDPIDNDYYSKSIKALVQKMLSLEPQDRPDINEICNIIKKENDKYIIDPEHIENNINDNRVQDKQIYSTKEEKTNQTNMPLIEDKNRMEDKQIKENQKEEDVEVMNQPIKDPIIPSIYNKNDISSPKTLMDDPILKSFITPRTPLENKRKLMIESQKTMKENQKDILLSKNNYENNQEEILKNDKRGNENSREKDNNNIYTRMDFAYEKMRLLGIKKKMKKPPDIHKLYFVTAQKGLTRGQQFIDFISICSWLFSFLTNDDFIIDKEESSILLATRVLLLLQKIIDRNDKHYIFKDISSADLINGYGLIICTILDILCDTVINKINTNDQLKIKKPNYIKETYFNEIVMDDLQIEENIENDHLKDDFNIVDGSGIENKDDKPIHNELLLSPINYSNHSTILPIINPTIDPKIWKSEYEKVMIILKDKENKYKNNNNLLIIWRNHYNILKKNNNILIYEKSFTISSLHTLIKYNNVQYNIIEKETNQINNLFSSYQIEYEILKNKNQLINEKILSLQDKTNEISNVLSLIESKDLDLKNQINERMNYINNTQTIEKIRQSNMNLINENKLLQVKISSILRYIWKIYKTK